MSFKNYKLTTTSTIFLMINFNNCDDYSVAYPGILFLGGGCSTNSVEEEDRENGDLGGGRPLVRGSGGSCNLVQEISFHIVRFS